MRLRHLGRSGLRVSEVCFGSWLTLGSTLDGSEAAELVHRAYDLGVNLFDTADVREEPPKPDAAAGFGQQCAERSARGSP